MITFEITDEEEKLIESWKKLQRKKDDTQYTLGERWGYKFIPTGLGTLVYLIDGVTGEEYCVRGTESW